MILTDEHFRQLNRRGILKVLSHGKVVIWGLGEAIKMSLLLGATPFLHFQNDKIFQKSKMA
jgi:hypothetical protein